MLQWWADYVEGILSEPKVIVGNFGGGAASRSDVEGGKRKKGRTYVSGLEYVSQITLDT
jgi:hypothetical protein